MTNREMLMEIKKIEPSLEHIKEVAEKILSNTIVSKLMLVNYIYVREYNVIVGYEYTWRGEWSNDEVKVPIEWFDEGFDYVKAYKEILCKEANRKRAEKARLKRAAEKRKKAKELKEKKDYNTYLKLKEKYESNGELT